MYLYVIVCQIIIKYFKGPVLRDPMFQTLGGV